MTEANGKTRRILDTLQSGAALAAVIVISLAVGFLVHAALTPPAREAEAKAPAGTKYTCSMHPHIRADEPGLCPICNMDLILLKQTSGEGSLRELSISEAAKALMEIKVEPVRRRLVAAEIRMVGKIDYDETRLATIAAWMPGRLDRLFVDYTGVPVKKGEHLVKIFSPDLIAAQEELLQAKKATKDLSKSAAGTVGEMTRATLVAVREKLRLLGLTREQIAKVESTGKVSDHLQINSPATGIVIHKHAKEGMYVKTGTPIYTVADLSTMWVRLEAYESDLIWLRYGQRVEFTTISHPGEMFSGTISFIDPVLNPRTRTVKVRVNVPNPKGKLKPGMFVKASVRSRVAEGGKVMEPALAGKSICPMHPEVIKDKPGQCDVCGMDLVPAESLGFVGADPNKTRPPLVIPATAPLITGTRAVVYVRVDPSLLNSDSVTDWPRLIARIKTYRPPPPPPPTSGLLNVACPIMGGAIDPTKLTPELTRKHKGGVVAFCCGGCPDQWDKLSEAEKARKLTAVAPGRDAMSVFLRLLGEPLKKRLAAVGPREAPPAEVQARFVRQINTIIQRRAFLASARFPKAVLDGEEVKKLIDLGVADLPPMRLTRLNRLLVHSLFPDAIAKGTAAPTFEGRQIVLGPRAGDYYLVRSGLAEGERVVTRGNFKIDSALQIMAKPSMMSAEGGGGAGDHAHHGGSQAAKKQTGKPAPAIRLPGSFARQMHQVLAAVDAVGRAVAAGESSPAVQKAFADLEKRVKDAGGDALTGQARLIWKEYAMRLTNDAVEGKTAETAKQAARAAASAKDNAAALRRQLGLEHQHAAPGGAGREGGRHE